MVAGKCLGQDCEGFSLAGKNWGYREEKKMQIHARVQESPAGWVLNPDVLTRPKGKPWRDVVITTIRWVPVSQPPAQGCPVARQNIRGHGVCCAHVPWVPSWLHIFPLPILALGGGCWEQSGVPGVGPAAPNNPFSSCRRENAGGRLGLRVTP